MIDPIGYYKGKPITEMTRDELLEFAWYAGKRIDSYQETSENMEDIKIEAELARFHGEPSRSQAHPAALFIALILLITALILWK